MIIWSGLVNDRYFYRCLGTQEAHSSVLHEAVNYCPVFSNYTLLRHNESTTRSLGTTPTIGNGHTSKCCRDYCIAGYSVGSDTKDPYKEPELFNYSKHHMLCYDIETEFAGNSECSLGSPILCVSLVCTCGWQLVISSRVLLDSAINHVVETTNEGIVVATISNIIRHHPTFTIGHNIYGFDNPVLALSLPQNHPYMQFFRPVSKTLTMTSPNMGLIMCIPGINNLDTYMFIRASMFGRFSI